MFILVLLKSIHSVSLVLSSQKAQRFYIAAPLFDKVDTADPDLSSFEKYYAGSRAEDIQVGTESANVAKCCTVRVFCRGLGGGASSARKLYPFISSLFPALNETMKKQITPGLEKTKRFISEIRYGALFKAQYRFTQK